MYRILILLSTLSVFSWSCSNQKKTDVLVSFEKLETNAAISLRGLFVVNENVVWASGVNGTVLKTTNGGENWEIFNITGEEENDFRSIFAWNENRVMVFGVAGPKFGYLSENGGESWQTVFQDSTKGLFFNSLTFADEKNGLAVSDPIEGKFFVIRTEDGGESWERMENLPPNFKGEANFAASNTCIEYLPSGKAWIASGGEVARVFFSEDFGKTWDVAETPIVSGESSSGIFSIEFKNDLEGVIVGGTYDKPELNNNISAYTKDGGKTWQTSEVMPAAYRSCVQRVSYQKSNLFFAIGKTGCDYSNDTGKSWQFLKEAGFYTFRAVPGKPIGFAAGNNGRISRVHFK